MKMVSQNGLPVVSLNLLREQRKNQIQENNSHKTKIQLQNSPSNINDSDDDQILGIVHQKTKFQKKNQQILLCK